MTRCSTLGQALQAFIYPPHCLLCDQLVEHGGRAKFESLSQGLCVDCIESINQETTNPCLRCSSPMDEVAGAEMSSESFDRDSDEPGGCRTCDAWPPARSFCRSLGGWRCVRRRRSTQKCFVALGPPLSRPLRPVPTSEKSTSRALSSLKRALENLDCEWFRWGDGRSRRRCSDNGCDTGRVRAGDTASQTRS